MEPNDRETVLVLDFGGQYNQLIARRVRECNVYCEILPCDAPLDRIIGANPKGVIFTGGPQSAYGEKAPRCDAGLFASDMPILGICYGGQLLSLVSGGSVARAQSREYGKTDITYDTDSSLFKGMPETAVCWMSHSDQVLAVPDGFAVTARTRNCPIAAFEDAKRKRYGVQFHPEVMHTQHGLRILQNFLYNICGCSGNWTMESFAKASVRALKEKIGNGRVLLALSGGVDSSVTAVLLQRAVGPNLTCIFVDHGLLRKNEANEVERVFKGQFDIRLIRVDAAERFLVRLKGVCDPEKKRKIIGEEFIRVFEEEARKLGGTDFLAQGTIYPDVIESGLGNAAVIKSHHNVGGLPDHVDFKEIVEPLRDLFKDEVRRLGDALGMPRHIVYRQPFPGPGLGIRIIGDVTREKLHILREADFILRDEIAKAGLDAEIWQYFAVLTGMRSVGVMGDERTYDYTVALRAVTSVDGMTADWARIPFDVMERISNRIINEVGHINRIVYDVTSKPPATIEWE